MYTLLAIFVLPAFLILLLRIGFVQAYVADRFANYLSEELHTEVTIGNVDFTYFPDFFIEGINIKDLHHNTLIDAKTMVVNFNDLFFDKNVIGIKNIALDHSTINLVRYKDEKSLNYQFIADYFSSGDTTKTPGGKNWKIWIASVKLINSNFKYQDLNQKPKEKGIDFSDLEMTGLNVKINNFVMVEDTFYADIRKLSVKDKSGFDLKNFSAKVKISPVGVDAENLYIETPGTILNMNLAFHYHGFNDFNNFIDKVKFDALFKPSRIDMNDIAYFAPDLWGMNDKINVCGEINGKISNLKGKNFQFLYGTSTYFLGNFNISGLPDIEGTYIHFNIKNLFTCQKDIHSFTLPASSSSQHLDLPGEVVKLGNVRFKGAFTGFYNDFVAYGDFNTDMGKVTTDLTLRKNHATNQIEYDGKISTADFNIGSILSMQKDLGYVSFNADVKGWGLDAESAAVNLKGNIASISYRNYLYKNIDVRGDLAKKKFNGFLKIDDENIKLDFTGMVDFSKDLPVFDIQSDIENLRLSKLHFMELAGDSLSSISSKLQLNFEGNTIDNIQGSITAENTTYTYKGEKHLLNSLSFINTAEKNGKKTMKLKSDYLDADISGNFMFNDLYLSSLKFMKDYLPTYSTWIKENLDSIPEQNFEYYIKLKNTSSLSKLFMPELSISNNTIVKGSYNTKQSLLDLNITSALSSYQKYKVKDFFLRCKTKDYKININLGCEQLSLSDSLGLDNFTLRSITQNDSISYKLIWKNNSDQIKNNGNINGFLTFFRRPKIELKFTDAQLVINDSTWNIDKSDDIVFDSNSVTVSNLMFYTKTQQLKISGTVSENPADIMYVNFKDFNVSDADALTSVTKFDFDGYLNGNIDISNIYHSLNIVSDLTINDLYVNKEKLGKAVFITTWDDQKKMASINSDIIYEGASGSNKPISISGNYFPDREKDNFDLDIEMTNFKLVLLEKYISSFSSSLKGFASGKVKLTGTPEEPNLYGHLFMMVKGFKIDYLNVNYSFSDSVMISNKAFLFDHLVINDMYGDTAVLDGKITHDYFRDVKFDLAIRPYNLQCLNTNAAMNSQFYGKAMATGLVKIYGDLDNIKMDIAAKTEKNTHIFIPISSESEISDNDYINFVNQKIEISKKDVYNVDLSGIQLNFVLDVTPDADIQIIFDSKIGDIIKAKGNGNLKMEITPQGDFNMYGDYVIDEGDYLFTLKNVINKKFIIQKGSSLKWNGSPYDGIADITAIYPVKAPLYDLVAKMGDTSAVHKKRIPVNCILGMNGKIFNPTLTFDIDLPNSSEDDKNLLKSIVNNEQEMNQQVFSLLIINRFTNPNNIQSASINEGLGATSTELLSNQLSNWLSQISKKVDIGVNYRPGNEITSDQLEFAFTSQLFNDRLKIESNIGVSGNQAGQGSTDKTSNLVGDVDLEYKLSKDGHILLKGYNKSNTVDMLGENSKNKQGIGVFYRTEFNSFRELLRRKKKTDEPKVKN